MHSSLLMIAASYIALSQAPVPHVHNEETWKKAAAFLKNGMNPNAQPCEDFYEHVCGNFKSDNDTEYPSLGMVAKQQNNVDKNLRTAIEQIDLNLEKSAFKKSVKIFYDQCVSVPKNPKWRKELFDAVVSRIGPIGAFSGSNAVSNKTDAQELWRLAGSVIQEFGRPVFALWQPVISLEEGAPLITHLNYTTDFAKGCNYSERFFQFEDVAQILGTINVTIEKWIADISQLCQDLRNATVYPSEKKVEVSGTSIYSDMAPNFDWKAFLEGQIPNEYHKIMNDSKNFATTTSTLVILDRIGRIFQKHEANTVHALAFLTILGKMQVWGEATKKGCVQYAKLDFGPALARIYFDYIGENISQWRDEIRLLGRNIKAAFTFVLSSADWLDSEDKEKIQKKLSTFQFYPGFPDWIENNNEIESRIPQYKLNVTVFENDFAGKKVVSKSLFSRFVAGRDIFEGLDFLLVVNAFYIEDYRMLNNNLGITLPPFFDIDYPIAVKYGLLGYVYAHEIMHGFDSTNIHSVRNESKRIKLSAMDEYKKQQQCLTTQFSAYCNQHQDLCVSGKFTLQENVADSAGVKIAYTAYKVLTQLMPIDPPMIGLLNYTYDQIFFISYAKFFCNYNRAINPVDPHAPDRSRVELALRNVRLFAKAFDCEMGSKYAPLTTCSVWADIANPAAL